MINFTRKWLSTEQSIFTHFLSGTEFSQRIREKPSIKSKEIHVQLLTTVLKSEEMIHALAEAVKNIKNAVELIYNLIGV